MVDFWAPYSIHSSYYLFVDWADQKNNTHDCVRYKVYTDFYITTSSGRWFVTALYCRWQRIETTGKRRFMTYLRALLLYAVFSHVRGNQRGRLLPLPNSLVTHDLRTYSAHFIKCDLVRCMNHALQLYRIDELQRQNGRRLFGVPTPQEDSTIMSWWSQRKWRCHRSNYTKS